MVGDGEGRKTEDFHSPQPASCPFVCGSPPSGPWPPLEEAIREASAILAEWDAESVVAGSLAAAPVAAPASDHIDTRFAA